MNWLNIRLATLRRSEYIGSDPTSRATWLNIAAYCAEQENGGRISGSKTWKCRQWQQTCGVMLNEINGADKLLTWDGEDLVVWNYSVEKEEEVKAKREAGKVGGNRSGEARTKKAFNEHRSTASTNGSTTPSREARTEGERKEKENRKEKGSASLPEGLDTPEFSAVWERFVSYRKRQKYKPLLPESIDALWRKMSAWGIEAAIAQIEDTISNGWQGVFAPKAGSKPVKPPGPIIPSGQAKPYDAPAEY